MIVSELIADSLDTTSPVFGSAELVEQVFSLMQRRGVEYAPVLHERQVEAVVSLSDLLPLQKSNKPLKELKLKKAESIGLHEHLFDIFPKVCSLPGTIIPVSDKDGHFVGVVDKTLFFKQIGAVFHLGAEEVTLELDVPFYDFKLSEVVATLEKNDATVLSFGMYETVVPGKGKVITFRLQTHDLFRLIKNFENYGYQIRYASPLFKEKDDEMREKALEVMRFMEM
ncbi:MAG: CBS domain-containing protein [Chlorobium sp.]|nr:MAG: CBS domain-containing protein [Chlorobium sp.]